MTHSDTHRMLHEMFNARDYAGVEARTAPGFMFEDLPRRVTLKTVAEFTDWQRVWVAAFSDAEVSTPQYLEGPDFSVASYHGRGTNDGAFGPFPATGRTIDVPFCEVLHFTADGLVLSGEIYYDQLSILTQLGLMPSPDAAVEEGTQDSVEPVVRRLIELFDRIDVAALRDLFTEDPQVVDELSRRWMRGSAVVEAYMAELEGAVSDVRSELSGYHETISGDTGIVTCWLEQDYTLEGRREHISAPTTIVLRRVGTDWKVCLVHSVPLAEAPGV